MASRLPLEEGVAAEAHGRFGRAPSAEHARGLRPRLRWPKLDPDDLGLWALAACCVPVVVVFALIALKVL